MPRVCSATISVHDVEVEGRPHAAIELFDPQLLVDLSAALHSEDNILPARFRVLATDDEPKLTDVVAAALLAHHGVQRALTLVLTPEAARDLRDDLDDVVSTVYYSPEQDDR